MSKWNIENRGFCWSKGVLIVSIRGGWYGFRGTRVDHKHQIEILVSYFFENHAEEFMVIRIQPLASKGVRARYCRYTVLYSGKRCVPEPCVEILGGNVKLHLFKGDLPDLLDIVRGFHETLINVLSLLRRILHERLFDQLN